MINKRNQLKVVAKYFYVLAGGYCPPHLKLKRLFKTDMDHEIKKRLKTERDHDFKTTFRVYGD